MKDFEITTFTDPRDEMEYTAIKAGDLLIMRENLNCKSFCNGEPIPVAENARQWKKAGKRPKPFMCSFNFNPNASPKLGKFFNENAITDLRGIAPEGWRIPTREDMEYIFSRIEKINPKITNNISVNYFDGESYESVPNYKIGLAQVLKGMVNFSELGLDESPAIKNWNSIVSENGNDSMNFSVLPTGFINPKGEFQEIGESAYYWADFGNNNYYQYGISSFRPQEHHVGWWNGRRQGFGYSVRCVKDFSSKT
jgi:uncharacterized protein (TIGR02145 family)